jgi:hypothetical protein
MSDMYTIDEWVAKYRPPTTNRFLCLFKRGA